MQNGGCHESEKVYICFYNDNSTTANISVKKKESFQKFDTDKDGNGKYTINREFTGSKDYLFITYTVPENGFYTFTSDAVNGASGNMGYGQLYVNESQVGSNMNIRSTEGTTGECYLIEGQSVYIRIYAYGSYPTSWEGVVINAKKTGDAPAENTVGSQVESITIPAKESVWYSFKVTEAADYIVTFPKMTAGSGSINARLYQNVTDDANNYYQQNTYVTLSSGAYYTINLEAGEKRYLKFTNNNSVDKEFQVMIQEAPVDDVVVSEENSVDLVLRNNGISFLQTHTILSALSRIIRRTAFGRYGRI